MNVRHYFNTAKAVATIILDTLLNEFISLIICALLAAITMTIFIDYCLDCNRNETIAMTVALTLFYRLIGYVILAITSKYEEYCLEEQDQ